MNRRSFLRSTGVLGTVAATGCSARLDPFSEPSTPEVTPTPEAPPTRAGTALTGIYPGGPNRENAIANLDAATEWLDRPPAVALVFVDALVPDDAKQGFVEGPLTAIWDAGHVPLITWQPFAREMQATSETVERAIAAGEHDDHVSSWATLLESWARPRGGRTRGRRFYFRPAHEMNGNWFPWSAVDSSRIDATVTPVRNDSANTNGSGGEGRAAGTPTDYVEMWRRLFDAFGATELDGSNVRWIWTVNADEIGGVRAEQYYPGDEYVDWVGLDGFNFGGSQSYSSWRTPEELFDPMLGRLRELTDKPVALTEFGSASLVGSNGNGEHRPARKAAWIEAAFEYVEANDIKMTCWFNIDKTGADEADWAVFGGDRGTERVTLSGERYRAYGAYNRTVSGEEFLGARTDYPPLLTDDEFAGTF
jgi:beta-mannanase